MDVRLLYSLRSSFQLDALAKLGEDFCLTDDGHMNCANLTGLTKAENHAKY